LGGFARKDHYVQHRRDVHMEEIPKGRGSGNLAKAGVREHTGGSREVASGASSGPHCRP
jgi:hypothetical protein